MVGITNFPLTQNFHNPRMDTYPQIKIKVSPQLSFDIQVEIIKRLPVRSLIQFRSVCKAWKSTIDNSDFIAGYDVRHHQSKHHLLVRYEVGDGEEESKKVKHVSFVDDDDTFPNQKFALTVPRRAAVTVGSSHGLLCLEGYLPDLDGFSVIATLWNPAIRKSIVVEVPYAGRGMSNYIVGFGVRPDTLDPKLVKITYLGNPEKMGRISSIPNQVMVFTLSSGEWTCLRSDNLPRKSIHFNHGRRIVIGQFIYWLALEWVPLGDQFRSYYLIISFDLITNEFRELHLPNSLANKGGSNLSISSLRESLVVVEYDRMIEPGTLNHGKRVCTVWMMEHGDSKALTKLFTVNAPNLSVSKFLGFRKNGEAVVTAEVPYEDYACALVVYEPWSEHVKELGIRGGMFLLSASFYTESLLLLDQDDGHVVKCGL